MMGNFDYYRTVMKRNLWPQVSTSVGFNPAQVSSAPGHIKAIYEKNLLKFEEDWRKQKIDGQQIGNPGGMADQPGTATPQRMMKQGSGYSSRPIMTSDSQPVGASAAEVPRDLDFMVDNGVTYGLQPSKRQQLCKIHKPISLARGVNPSRKIYLAITPQSMMCKEPVCWHNLDEIKGNDKTMEEPCEG
jgi:hypothetical protein